MFNLTVVAVLGLFTMVFFFSLASFDFEVCVVFTFIYWFALYQQYFDAEISLESESVILLSVG